ncbi:hypothetical protein NVV99_22085 [Rhodococcus sp. PAE-6]|uniref:hypothetical protein n=1 Tax=Rhodococcus sp. PAE-6 TaxID=2972477 RepID=UPI0021B4C3E2|nr:hypothetical protein [Rhodococcus sp. PAE-6]MCT7293605.1 hypothetical protein [Rhodococcus sp. PAE-6]
MTVQSTRASTSGSDLSHSNQLIIFNCGKRCGTVGSNACCHQACSRSNSAARPGGGVVQRPGLDERHRFAVLDSVVGVEVRDDGVVTAGTDVGTGQLRGELAGFGQLVLPPRIGRAPVT